MGESIRRQKSMWDSIEETPQPAPVDDKHDSFTTVHMDHNLKWSDSDANNSAKPKDSRRLSGEHLQGNINKNDEIRNLDRNSHSRRALEGENSDGWGGVMNSSHSPENNRILPNRYKRSRSRSHSRGRGRSRSRSRSRSRGRYRNRDQRSMSRSPLPERRQEPHGGAGFSSQACRDFTSTGKCRRGNQCRFLHDDNSIVQQGGLRIEKDRSERWNRQDGGNSHYQGEKDAPFRNSGSNSALPCREFLKGRCHRGSSCRYPHHDASGETTMGRSHRSSYINEQDDREKPSRNSKQPCKYFMMGKCHKDNCSFSHDAPIHNSFEKKPQDDRWSQPESDTKLSTGGWVDMDRGGLYTDPTIGLFTHGTWEDYVKADVSNWGGPSDVLGLPAGNLSVNAEKLDKAANGNESVSSFSNGISRVAHVEDKRPDAPLAPLVDYANPVNNALGSYSSVIPSPLPRNFPLVKPDTEKKVAESEQNEQVSNFLPSITHILDPEQLPQLYAALNPPNSSIPPMPSFPPITSMDAQPIPTALLRRNYSELESDQKDGSAIRSELLSQVKNNGSDEDENQVVIANTLTGEKNQSVVPVSKEEQDKDGRGNLNVEGKGKETTVNEKDEKALKLFKVSLVELVKEVLKPKWKEGHMSRDSHKTIVKKVVDKVTGSLQGDNIPNTPQKIEQYLSYSKTKISKLAEAYADRLKKGS
ncbi:zinc finger CCCH domain-containing protein 55-like isoform X2 [Impatiens glandulifera]|nr:zinc finger CCCH domain-containing protein 55-like isoform X2 [Impatiens glandulifera]